MTRISALIIHNQYNTPGNSDHRQDRAVPSLDEGACVAVACLAVAAGT